MHSKNVICMIHHGINFDIAKKKGCQSVKTMNMSYFRRVFFFSAKHERRCGYRYIYIYIQQNMKEDVVIYIYIYIYILMLMVFKEPNITAK